VSVAEKRWQRPRGFHAAAPSAQPGCTIDMLTSLRAEMPMKYFLAIFPCILVTTTLNLVPSRSAQRPFSLTISTEHDRVKVGSEVLVQITLTNTSDQEIALGKAPGNLPQAESEYLVEVHDSRGQTAPDTDYGRKIKQNKIVVSFSRVSATVGPGESLKDGVILTKLYDLSRPGKYSVQLLRKVPPQLGDGLIKSNKVTITVTE
jgi:hypothetical protein